MFGPVLTIASYVLFDTGAGLYALRKSSFSELTPSIQIHTVNTNIKEVIGVARWNGTTQTVLSIEMLLNRAHRSPNGAENLCTIMLSAPFQGLAFAGRPVTQNCANPACDLKLDDHISDHQDAIIGTIDFPGGHAEVLDEYRLIPRNLRVNATGLVNRFVKMPTSGSPLPVRNTFGDAGTSLKPTEKEGAIAIHPGKKGINHGV